MKKPKFKSYREVLKDQKWEYFIVEEIQQLYEKQVELLKDLPDGFHLKNNVYNNLQKRGLLDAEGLRREMELIDAKQSKLPSLDRRIVRQIVWNAMAETIKYYKK